MYYLSPHLLLHAYGRDVFVLASPLHPMRSDIATSAPRHTAPAEAAAYSFKKGVPADALPRRLEDKETIGAQTDSILCVTRRYPLLAVLR